MQLTIDQSQSAGSLPPFRRFLAPVCACFALLLFLAIPMPLSEKAHAFLHGICAQRPSHTLQFGESLLPFDARMTGIYTGFLTAFVALIVKGRHRRAGLPGIVPGIILLLLLGSMAIDGFNSLFNDMGFSTPYDPDNRLRLLTGMAAGVGLATMAVMLVGMTFWRRPRVREQIVDHWWQPLALYVAGLPLLLIMMSGWSPLFAPLTLLLMSAAVMAFASLATVSLIMIMGKENHFDRASDVQPYVVLGSLIGVVVIAVLAGGRFALESWTNAPPLT